jgi:hypothetical protein
MMHRRHARVVGAIMIYDGRCSENIIEMADEIAAVACHDVVLTDGEEAAG